MSYPRGIARHLTLEREISNGRLYSSFLGPCSLLWSGDGEWLFSFTSVCCWSALVYRMGAGGNSLQCQACGELDSRLQGLSCTTGEVHLRSLLEAVAARRRARVNPLRLTLAVSELEGELEDQLRQLSLVPPANRMAVTILDERGLPRAVRRATAPLFTVARYRFPM